MSRPHSGIRLNRPSPQRRWQRWIWQVRRFLLELFAWDGWPKVASLATAAAAVAALWFTGHSLSATENQYGLSEQGQVTDRFSKATEQIGSDNMDVRLGGIYSLERLARDSPTDHPTVFEVLGAFVRTHAPATSECSQRTNPGRMLAVDSQAAVTVIGRRDATRDGPNPIDLANTCVSGAHLNDANLYGANLTGTDLTGTDLTDADLYGAAMSGANLAGADLTDADLSGADLTDADLYGANLTGTNLTGAKLTGVDLTDIYYDQNTAWSGFTPPSSRPNR